jgi:hypothetical protein
MAKHYEKLIFGGLHEKHTVQHGIWIPAQHSLCDQGKPRETLIELEESFICLHNIYKFGSNLTGNTLRLIYRAQPVNAVEGNSRCLL